MRVALCVAGMDRSGGGLSRSVCQLAEALGELGVELVVVTRESSDRIGIPETVKAALYRQSPKECSEVFRNVDIVHDNGIWSLANYQVAQLAARFNRRLIVSPRGMLEPWALSYHRYRKRVAWQLYQRKILQGASGILVTAESEQRAVESVLPGKICGISPNGIDLNRFVVPPGDERRKQFLLLSRIHPIKGIENLLAAWSSIPTSGWELIIAGDGDPRYVERVQKQARDLSGVAFVGPTYGDAKVRLFQESRFFVLPTFSENFGIAVLEALACGCPTITTTGAPWQEIRDQKCGWWIEPTVAALAEALLQAMGSTEYSQLSKNARKLAESRFSWDSAARAALAFYERILEQKEQ